MADVLQNKKILIAVQCVYGTFQYLCKGIGLCCNASRARPFTKAECNVFPICNCGEGDGPVSVGFKFLFETGFRLISELKLGKRKYEEIEAFYKRAFEILDQFIKRKSFHEERLHKLLNNGDKLTETVITTALAEHLLVQLSPGQSYTIDKRCRDKSDKACECGCGAKLNFGDTGIGHEEVWHGFIDIMLSSHEGKELETSNETEPDIETAVVIDPVPSVTKKLKQEFDQEECCRRKNKEDPSNTMSAGDKKNEQGDSPGGKCPAEVKIDLDDNIDTEDQTIAQAIVFSMLQQQRHPDFKNFLIPTIVISREQLRIIMYDAENDVLLQSGPLSIFVTSGSSELSSSCIIIFWMVLHYRIFCSGLKKDDLYEDLDKVRSGFIDRISPECIEIYKTKLKSCVASFPRIERKCHIEEVVTGRNPLYKPLKPSCILDFGLNMD